MRESIARDISSTQEERARLKYLPGLDGLRAVAIMAVLLYHADQPWIPGGYLGVEVFFVLSGYLITSLLLSEWRKTGKINLGQFWLRRARRLLPALFLLLGALSLFAVIFLPDEVARLRGDSLAASGYVTNWYLVFSQQSYFEFVGRPSLLQHLWSLAVEEQFYLLWPLLFVAGMSLLKRRLAMLMLTLAGAVASMGLMLALYNPDTDPSRVYYGTDTRAAALLIGCALAFTWTWVKGARRKRDGFAPATAGARGQGLWLDLAGLAGLVALAAIFANLDESQPFLYQGGFAITALVTAVLIAVAIHPSARIVPGMLGWGLMRWIGMRSYGIYLWHWLVFEVTRPQLDVSLDGAPLLALRIGITFALAELSYRFVEQPVREGAIGRFVQKWREARGAQRRYLGARIAVATALSVMLASALGTALAVAKPPATPDYLLELEADATALPEATAQIPVAVSTEAASSRVTPVLFMQGPETTETPLPVSTQPEPIADTPTPTPTPPATVVIPGLPICNTPIDVTVTVEPTRTEAIAMTPTPRPTATRAATATITPKPPIQLTAISTKPIPTSATVTYTGHVYALGDSVMLSGAKELRKVIPNIEIDAVVSRQLAAGIIVLKARRDAGTLGDTVVIDMGNNGTFSAKNFDQIMQILGSERRVIFINNKVPRPWERTNNTVIVAGVQRYPNTEMVDWRAASIDHPELFAKDGIHLQTAGARLYTQLLVDQLNK